MRLLKFFLTAFICASLLCAGDLYADTCNPGQYMNDENVCESCMAGYYCDGENEPQMCSGATVSGTGANECDSCTENAPYSNEEHTQCVVCDGVSQYVSDGVCTTCPSGAFADAGHTECVECESGRYMLNGVCTTCPDGFYCDGNGLAQNCSDGLYVNINRTGCVASCDSVAQYQSNGMCKICGAGSRVNDAHSKCSECTAGFYCPGDGTEIVCAKGFYSGRGAESCTACPTGYTTVSTISTSGAACKLAPIVLSVNNSSLSLPSCLKQGKINTRVVKNTTE